MGRFRARLGRAVLVTVVMATVAGPAEPAAAVEVHKVVMKDDFFKPKIVSVSKGDKVKWINRGDRPHTTTGPGWDVTLSPGEVYRRRFRKTGTFNYYCRFHSGMTGKVIVA